MSEEKALYLDAAGTFAGLVERIEPEQWSGPGLGSWDLRSLVGHASRALSTALDYLDRPAPTQTVGSAEEYYAASRAADPAAIAERGRAAGIELGPDPAATICDLLTRLTARLAEADPDAVITTIAGGMRVSAYLPTRTFEVVVHSLDIATATGLPVSFSEPVQEHVLCLAGRIAVRLDAGQTLLAALTGRRTLPDGWSIVG